jgi:membrane dipeptidase
VIRSVVNATDQPPTVRFPIFDGHNDVLLRLDKGHRLFFERNEGGHVDLPRALEGGLGGGFCAVFVRTEEQASQPDRSQRFGGEMPEPRTPDLSEAQSSVVNTMARLFRIEAESEERVKVVRTANEIAWCLQKGVFAALLHIEGAEAIDPEMDALEVFYQAGLRSIGPVWSRSNAFGHGVPFRFPHSPDTGPGLTELGKELVRACNRLRIVLDLSHLNEQGFWDVARLSDAPLVATHSNAHAITPFTRNLTDKQLDAIKESDGMVGVNFAVAFLRPDGAPEPDTPLNAVVDHFDYLVDRMGIDHVGFGSDFDGAMIPQRIGDASGLPNLVEALASRGYDDTALRKVTHENWIRVLKQTWGD